MDPTALWAFLEREFPAALEVGFVIERADATGVRLRLPAGERHLRPGGTVMGPTLMMLADTGAYLAILSRLGPVDTVTTGLEIHFLRRAPPGDLVADTRLLKVGRRLAVAVVDVTSADAAAPIAHATVTYALPEHAGGDTGADSR